jgi:hypothetical protein
LYERLDHISGPNKQATLNLKGAISRIPCLASVLLERSAKSHVIRATICSEPMRTACWLPRYVARYNLGVDVPYTPYTNSDVRQPVISATGRGQARPIWSLLYGRYVQRKGLSAPELAKIIAASGPDGGGGDYGANSGGFDQLGYGTLTFCPTIVRELQPCGSGAAARAPASPPRILT